MIRKVIKKSIICIGWLCINICVNGQTKLTADFNGNIKYVDNYIRVIISYDSCGSFLTTQNWEFKNGYITIETFDPLDSINFTSVPIRFFKNANSIRLTYTNPKDHQADTIEQFRIKQGDTLYSIGDFRLSVERDNWGDMMENTYIGDTTITVANIKFECYRFEQFQYYMKTFPGWSHFKKIVYIDKETLVPIQEDHLSFYKSHFCIPKQEWLLLRQVKIENIQPD
jgi:hypothetical protein